MITQGRKGISMAHRAALGCLAVARQLSVVVMVVSIVALVAGTVGTSYAKKKVSAEDRQTEDTVVVTNFGSLFAGSVETFAAGSVGNVRPFRVVKGSNTLVGAGNGASGDAQSSLDGDIAVTVPFGVPGLCPAGCLFVWPAGANGNTAPEEIIGGPAGTTGLDPFLDTFPVLNNNTGLFLDQGVAFDNPFRIEAAHNTSQQLISFTDRMAVANFGAVVLGSTDDFVFCRGAAFEEPAPTVGTITVFNGEQTGNVPPTPNFPVFEAAFPPSTAIFFSNATIGGCDTFLFGPIGVAFDDEGDLWVVDNLAKFVTEYPPFASGDASPINIVGLTPGTFIDPVYIAVGTNPLDESGDQVIYVTDDGDNSIKLLDVNEPFVDNFLGSISGGHTKLSRPQGIALLGDDLYVVNALTNSLLMFDDLVDTGLGNIRPKVLIKGKATKMNFPVGVAAPQFSPPL